MPKTFSSPGPRLLYPEMVSSRSLARCGLVANALWPRLIVQADDQGRSPGDPAAVLVACFPKLLALVSLADIETATDELRRAGMVSTYRDHGEIYLQILDWWRWQQGMRRAYPSRFPPPRGWTDVLFGVEGAPPSFRPAAEAAGIVLSGNGNLRADRPQPARNLRAERGRVPAGRPQSAANARAQGPNPLRPNPPESARTESAPLESNPSPAAGEPPDSGRSSSKKNGADEPPLSSLEQTVALYRDLATPEPARRAARRALQRHDPEQLERLDADLAALGADPPDDDGPAFGTAQPVAPRPSGPSRPGRGAASG